MRRNFHGSSAIVTLALMLAGCGGGGGGGMQSTPTPTPSPTQAPVAGDNPVSTTPPPTATPTPTPTPTPSPTPTPAAPTVNYDDAEYRRSNAASAANAISAYNAGATGQGTRIAIVDSGLTDPGSEFAGRIDAASRAFGGNTSFADSDGHGTSVAGVAAASRNGTQTMGVAFGATILALRADTAGTCGTTDGCKYSHATLAQAIDHAVASNATVINLSLGGESEPSQTLRAAMARATAAGVILVIAAGNSGADADGGEPEPFARIAADAAVARGLIVIAGAHDATNAAASFANKAGSFAPYYLTALGSRVRGFDETGQSFLYSGTSYATPAISGAVALLRSAFPNLSATQALSLLFNSATDAGAAGTDPIYGRGILNLARAFQPAGSTSLAGSAVPVSLASNGIVAAAMGDATARPMGESVILDSYGRAFTLPLARTLGRVAQRRPLAMAIGGFTAGGVADAGALSVSVTTARDPGADQPWLGLAQRQTALRPAGRAIAGTMLARIDARTTAALGFAPGGAALADRVSGRGDAAAFLIARAPTAGPGFDTNGGVSLAAAHRFGQTTLALSGEQGQAQRLARQEAVPPAYAMLGVSGMRPIGALTLSLGAGMLREARSVLGSRFGAALGSGGALTTTGDAAATLALGDGWQAGTAWRRAWTRADRGGLMAADGRLRSDAFAFDIAHAGRANRLGLRLAQPLRVSGGGYRLSMPVAYDYATLTTTYAERRWGLAPDGRERIVEAAWGRRLGIGWLDANLFWRRQPGNIAAAPDDLGAVLRFATRW
ncbi:MAG: S8 family serine peptidase [Sphingomonas fennica]